MKKTIMIAAAMMLAAGAWAQKTVIADNTVYENCIQVNGKAEKEVTPDEIYVRIVIDESVLKQRQSVDQMERDMISALKKLGIDTDKDLKIDNMSSQYRDYFLKKNTPRTSASYELKVGGAQMLGRVYQAVGELGISNMSITSLSHSKIKEYQNEVRMEAVKNARQVADSIAAALGQKAGRAFYVVDYNNDPYIPMPMARANDMMLMKTEASTAGGYDTPLDFKDIKLTYNITVKFVLE